MAQPPRLTVGVERDDLPPAESLLEIPPELDAEQVAVLAEERLPQLPLEAEEGEQLGGEDVLLSDPEPGLGRHLLQLVARRRQLPEGEIGQRAELVVVVGEDAAVAGDAEVLEQHVAREDV